MPQGEPIEEKYSGLISKTKYSCHKCERYGPKIGLQYKKTNGIENLEDTSQQKGIFLSAFTQNLW